MSETNTSNIQTEQPMPNIVYGEGAEQRVLVDPLSVANTMQELGISDASISRTTIYIDPKNRILNRGTHYTNRLGRLRFRSNAELQEAEGDIIRLSMNLRGEELSADSINRTLTHELVHGAQEERHDKNLTAGHIAVYGLAAVGAIVGARRGKGTLDKLAKATAGALVGYEAGYTIAPHEHQARKIAGTAKRAGQITSKAVQRKR